MGKAHGQSTWAKHMGKAYGPSKWASEELEAGRRRRRFRTISYHTIESARSAARDRAEMRCAAQSHRGSHQRLYVLDRRDVADPDPKSKSPERCTPPGGRWSLRPYSLPSELLHGPSWMPVGSDHLLFSRKSRCSAKGNIGACRPRERTIARPRSRSWQPPSFICWARCRS
jgi:hypothetical protein